MAKFHEKAIAIYGLPQNGENLPVVVPLADTLGKIVVTGTKVYGTSATKFWTNPITGDTAKGQLTVGAYIFKPDGTIIGQIASIESDTEATLVTALTTPIGTYTAGTGGAAATLTDSIDYSVGLGPKNCMAVLNLNFNSTEITSEAYQYAGDELDRSETTVVTDWTAKLDFETFLPVLGEVSGTPSNDQIIGKDWFAACGFNATPATRSITFSNIASTNVYLTVEVRRSSPDMPINHKVYTMSDVRGTVDLDIVIGTKAKLKWNMFGNYKNVADKKKITADPTTLTNQKLTIGGTVNTNSISSCILKIKDATGYELSSPTATVPASGDIIGFGGLTITLDAVKTAPTKAKLYEILAQILPGMSSVGVTKLFEAEGGTVTVTGTFGKWDVVVKSTLSNTTAAYSDGGLVLTPVYPSKGTTAPNFTWKLSTGAAKTVNTTSFTVSIGVDETTKNVTFDKLSAPNFSGFEYNRFRTSSFDSWSKGATPSDVSFTILEDQKTGNYVPENELENEHELQLSYTSGGSRTTITFQRLQLTNIANSTIASYAARDLTFRNTASKSDSLGTKITLEYKG